MGSQRLRGLIRCQVGALVIIGAALLPLSSPAAADPQTVGLGKTSKDATPGPCFDLRLGYLTYDTDTGYVDYTTADLEPHPCDQTGVTVCPPLCAPIP